MNRILLVLASVVMLTGCATTGNTKLDANTMVVESTVKKLTRVELIARFGEPLATKEVEGYTLLGYRKRDVQMNAWSIVPFVGLVAGGVDEIYTTCIAKVSAETDLVESVSCSTDKNFQSNAETMVGDRINESELRNIFGAPLKK